MTHFYFNQWLRNPFASLSKVQVAVWIPPFGIHLFICKEVTGQYGGAAPALKYPLCREGRWTTRLPTNHDAVVCFPGGNTSSIPTSFGVYLTPIKLNPQYARCWLSLLLCSFCRISLRSSMQLSEGMLTTYHAIQIISSHHRSVRDVVDQQNTLKFTGVMTTPPVQTLS